MDVQDVERWNVILVAVFMGRGFNRDMSHQLNVGYSLPRVCVAIGN